MSTLYLIATPIGNLEDLSPRAISTLQNSDVIGCEDTRTSGRLLKRFDIDKPLFPFHQHNEHQKVSYLTRLLDEGKVVSLITDAGMPGISDPGFLATRAAHQQGHSVCVIPGPDAATTALAGSGLPSDRYFFEGFLPMKKGRQTRLQELAEMDVTVILYESPHRFMRLLGELESHMEPGRFICICRELTKKFEEVQRGTLREIIDSWNDRTPPKGEFVIVLAGKNYRD